jgi:hypothetical protein
MRRRYARWRDACYRFIEDNGPTPVRILAQDLYPMRNGGGRPSANSAAQVLRSDPRFRCIEREEWEAMGNDWPYCTVWGLSDED